MILIAMYAAGLFLLLREALPWLRAKSSGIVHTRGHRRTPVQRDVEPEKYAVLMHNRFKAMLPGGMLLIIAAAWTIWTIIGLMLTVPET